MHHDLIPTQQRPMILLLLNHHTVAAAGEIKLSDFLNRPLIAALYRKGSLCKTSTDVKVPENVPTSILQWTSFTTETQSWSAALSLKYGSLEFPRGLGEKKDDKTEVLNDGGLYPHIQVLLLDPLIQLSSKGMETFPPLLQYQNIRIVGGRSRVWSNTLS